jgi:hypothetical protein
MLRTVSLVSYFKSLINKKVILIFNHKIVLCNILYAKVASWIISAMEYRDVFFVWCV